MEIGQFMRLRTFKLHLTELQGSLTMQSEASGRQRHFKLSPLEQRDLVDSHWQSHVEFREEFEKLMSRSRWRLCGARESNISTVATEILAVSPHFNNNNGALQHSPRMGTTGEGHEGVELPCSIDDACR